MHGGAVHGDFGGAAQTDAHAEAPSYGHGIAAHLDLRGLIRIGTGRGVAGFGVRAGLGGLGIGRRFFQLDTALCHYQIIDGVFLAVAVNRQLETFRQQRLKHLGNLVLARARGHFSEDIEALGAHPIRAGQLVGFDVVGGANQV